MEEKRGEVQKEHKILVVDREIISLTGVEEVESFDEKEISLITSLGSLVLEGEDFKMNMLSVESGEMEISGYLNGARYNDYAKSTGSFWQKIFK